MNIALFNNVFPPVKSGSSNFVSHLSKRLVKRGHKVIVITSLFPRTKREEVIEGVKIYRLPCIRFPKLDITLKYGYITVTFTPMNIWRIIKILKENKSEIMQVHGQIFDLSLGVRLVKKFLKIPSLILVHTYVMHQNRFYNWALKLLDKTFARFIMKGYDVVPCGEKYSVKYIRERYKIEPWLYRGIISPVELNGVGNIPELSEHTILSVGHIHKIRPGTVMVAGMPKILAKFPDAKLLFIGDVYDNAAVKLTKKLGLEKSVTFLGSKPHRETLAYIKSTKVHACGLGFGFAIGKSGFESMALETVVMSATDEDYFGKGILKNFENIVLVEKNNPEQFSEAVIKLFANPELMRKIEKNGRLFMEQYLNWDNTCNAFEDIYSKLSRSSKDI